MTELEQRMPSRQSNLPDDKLDDKPEHHMQDKDEEPCQRESGVYVEPTPVDAILGRIPSVGAAAPIAIASVDNSHGSQDKHGEDTDYITGYKLVLAMAALNLSALLIFLDNSILSTAIPTITNEFHSVQDVGWYVSSYQLALSALQPLTGKLFTYLPNKWTYISFLALFELGSLICGLANSSNMLIGGRAVAGLGASGLFNGAMTIISALVPLHRRPALTGLIMGISQLGLIGGPLIGGSLTEYATWRWCFYINLPIGGLAAIMLALVHISEQTPKPHFKTFITSPNLLRSFDLPGIVILVPCIVMLLLALHFGGGEYPWKSATVIGLFCGFAVTAVLFVLWEWRAGEDAIVPASMVTNRVVVAACATNLCLFGCTFVASYFMPIYFQSVQGSTPFISGVHLLPSIIAQMIMSVVSGFAVSKFGFYLPWSIFCAVVASVGTGLVATWSVNTGTGKWIGYQIIQGAGRGTGMQMAMVAVQAVLPQSQIAIVMAILVFTQSLASSVLFSIANTIFDNSLISEIRARAPGVEPEAVIAAGATAFRKVVPKTALPGVVEAYAISFDRTFYLAVALVAVTFLTSWGLGNHDVRKKIPEAAARDRQDAEKAEEAKAEETKGDGMV